MYVHVDFLHKPSCLCSFDRSCRPFPACGCKSRVSQRRVISVCYRNQFSADQANAGRRLLPGHRAKAFCTPPEAKLSLDENAATPDGHEAPSADVFSLFFFRERSNFFATFCTPRLGTIDIFACTNSRSLEEGERERESSLFYETILSRFFFFFVTSPLCFPRVFLEQKATKISTEFFIL